MAIAENSQSLKQPLSERFDAAIMLASRLHHRQARKGTDIPHLLHILGVVVIALKYGATEDEAIAALLHDAIEDRGGVPTEQEIREQFGGGVAEIVRGCRGCPDADGVPDPEWRVRKEAYVAHVRTASPSVRLVSASDKLQYLRGLLGDYQQLGDALWPRLNGGKEGTLWYYRALVSAFREAGASALVEELGRTVAELEGLARGS
ncbi:MAG: HD domain-containing protein [Elusimicrobia bacterium]|nr:HD domain-containing protein [Elusimicrobiota bacterium]